MPHVNVNGARLYYEVHGSGTPVLLLNITSGTRDLWDRFQMADFARDHTVVSFDYRGVGQSEAAGERWTLALFADDGFELMRHLGLERAHVLGHSVGARVAQHVYLRHPELVRSLVLASGGCGQYDPAQYIPRGLPIGIATTVAEQGLEGYMRGQASGRFNWTREAREQHRDLVESFVQFQIERLPSINVYFKHVIARQEDDTCALVSQIAAPALLIAGEGETVVHGTTAMLPASRWMQEQMPDAELFVVPGAAHMHFWQEPELVNARILDFWRRVEAAEKGASRTGSLRMRSGVETRLGALGLELPPPMPLTANYVGAVRTGNLVFVAAHGPYRDGGYAYGGKLGLDLDTETGREAAQLSMLNCLAALKAEIGDLDRVRRVVRVFGMVSSAPEFTEHPQVINGASDLLTGIFGDRGKHARAAVGMAALPRNIPVTIEMLVEVE